MRAVATVTSIEGTVVDFEVSAYDQYEQIGSGAHRRAVIELSRFQNRVARKSGRSDEMQPQDDLNSDDVAVIGGNLPQLVTISVAVAGQTATITLNRPQSLNAVNQQMTDEWQNVLSWLKGHPDDVRVVIVTGSGSAFCAGDDVKELASLTTEEVRELSLKQAQIYLGFESLPQVVIGAINGDALGAGCVCAVACDMRIAGQMARFGMPEIALGWAPGYGIAQLTALVGKARALKMCLTAEPITAKQALDWGLVNEVVPQNQLMERARAVSERLLSMPPIALRETKNLIHADEGPWTKSSYVRDTEAYMRCLMTDDAKEGIKAFKQKRQPNF